jgi:lipopolysaccharide export system permease protein
MGVFNRLIFFKFQYPLQLSTQKIMQESRLPLEMSLSELHQYIQHLEDSGQNVAALKVRWHQKIALPMTTLIFILLGAAMGARTLSSRLQGFGFSLLLVFVYYLFFAIGTAMGDSGRVPAWFAAWLADGLTAISMFFLVWKRNQWG